MSRKLNPWMKSTRARKDSRRAERNQVRYRKAAWWM